MIPLFIVNVIMVTLVTRESGQKVGEENPNERITKEPFVAELMTEEELEIKKTDKVVVKENPSQTTETKKNTRDPFDAELVTDKQGNAANSTTGQEVVTEDSGLKTDKPGKKQKMPDSTDSKSGEEGNTEDSAKLSKLQELGENTQMADVGMISTGATSPPEALTEDQREKPEMESVQQVKPFYELRAALTAMWLPAVVGDKKKMFIAASLSTLFAKILMLLVSVNLAFFFQENMHSRPFVLWSGVGKSLKCSMKYPMTSLNWSCFCFQ